MGTLRGLPIRDTADCQSALRWLCQDAPLLPRFSELRLHFIQTIIIFAHISSPFRNPFPCRSRRQEAQISSERSMKLEPSHVGSYFFLFSSDESFSSAFDKSAGFGASVAGFTGCATGSAGLAGLWQLLRRGGGSPEARVAVLFTGRGG